MRRIALINQKGGVGKTTATVNLGAALALAGKRVVVVDLDPQANLTLFLGVELAPDAPSSYRVLTGEASFGAALRATSTPNLRLLPTDIHLSGAELELSSTQGREKLFRAALDGWVAEHKKTHRGEEPADYVLFDCPPSLGLLSLNALAAADEVFLVVQTQFLALQGMSKLVEVIELVKQRLHPGLKLSGIVPCMYDSRMRLAREVLAELRRYFPAQVFRTPISANVKLAESPSFAKTIFEYAPDSIGARDFASLSHEVLTQEVLARTPAEPEPARKKLDLGEALRGASHGAARALTSPPEVPARLAPSTREAAKPAAFAASALTPAVRTPVAKRVEPVRVVPVAPHPVPPVAAAPSKRTPAPAAAPVAPVAAPAPAAKAKKVVPVTRVEPARAPLSPTATRVTPPVEKTIVPAVTTPARKCEPTTPAATTPPPAKKAGAPLVPAPTAAPAPRAHPLAPKAAMRDSVAPARPASTKLEPRREPPAPPALAASPATEAKPEGGARRPRSKPGASG